MDSNELNFYMMKDLLIRRRLISVYPIDMIPEDFVSPLILIISLDKSYESGSHWIVIHQKDTSRLKYLIPLERNKKKKS